MSFRDGAIFRNWGAALGRLALIASLSGFAPGWLPSSEQLDFALGHYTRALPRLSEAARRGEPMAERDLGVIYRDGLGVEEDMGLGVRWLLKAALDGDVRAQYDIGLALDDGEGVRRDPAQARHWYEIAARHGSAPAAYNLAIMYREAAGGKRNISAAIDWLNRAIELGAIDGARDLGALYFERDRSSLDRILGYMWFLVARASGDTGAMHDLRAYRHWLDNAQHRQAHLLAKRQYARLLQGVTADGKPSAAFSVSSGPVKGERIE